MPFPTSSNTGLPGPLRINLTDARREYQSGDMVSCRVSLVSGLDQVRSLEVALVGLSGTVAPGRETRWEEYAELFRIPTTFVRKPTIFQSGQSLPFHFVFPDSADNSPPRRLRSRYMRLFASGSHPLPPSFEEASVKSTAKVWYGVLAKANRGHLHTDYVADCEIRFVPMSNASTESPTLAPMEAQRLKPVKKRTEELLPKDLSLMQKLQQIPSLDLDLRFHCIKLVPIVYLAERVSIGQETVPFRISLLIPRKCPSDSSGRITLDDLKVNLQSTTSVLTRLGIIEKKSSMSIRQPEGGDAEQDGHLLRINSPLILDDTTTAMYDFKTSNMARRHKICVEANLRSAEKRFRLSFKVPLVVLRPVPESSTVQEDPFHGIVSSSASTMPFSTPGSYISTCSDWDCRHAAAEKAAHALLKDFPTISEWSLESLAEDVPQLRADSLLRV